MNKPFLSSCIRASLMSSRISLGLNTMARDLTSVKNSSETYYETLGVGQDATQTDIKSAFYEKSKKCHPDSAQSSSNDSDFLAICKAYETLKKKDTRRQYDSFIQDKKQRLSNFQRPLHSYTDFEQWRAEYPSGRTPRNWDYGYEGDNKIDYVACLYFSIFCGVCIYILVNEKRRRENKVSGYVTKFSMSKRRQNIPKKDVTQDVPDKSTHDRKAVKSTSTTDDEFSDLKSWK